MGPDKPVEQRTPNPEGHATTNRRLKRFLAKKRILPTPMAVKKYGNQEVRVAQDGRSYLVLPNGQWIRVVSEIKKDQKAAFLDTKEANKK